MNEHRTQKLFEELARVLNPRWEALADEAEAFARSAPNSQTTDVLGRSIGQRVRHAKRVTEGYLDQRRRRLEALCPVDPARTDEQIHAEVRRRADQTSGGHATRIDWRVDPSTVNLTLSELPRGWFDALEHLINAVRMEGLAGRSPEDPVDPLTAIVLDWRPQDRCMSITLSGSAAPKSRETAGEEPAVGLETPLSFELIEALDSDDPRIKARAHRQSADAFAGLIGFVVVRTGHTIQLRPIDAEPSARDSSATVIDDKTDGESEA